MDKTIEHERAATRACGSAWRSTTAAGPNWSTPSASIAAKFATGKLDPDAIDEDAVADASLHGRHARSRPVDPHGRRNADQQFPAVADQLRRNLGHQRFWPEFDESDLHQAIRDFAARDRRFGGLNE